MNIRFAILSLVLVFFIIAPAIAQESPKPTHTSTAAAVGATSAAGGSTSAQSGSSSALPNEKTLLIGGGSNAANQSVKPVKALGVWDFVQMILVLGLVVAGIYLLFYFLKKMGGPKAQDNALIGVLSTKVLQPNRAIHLVDVGGQLYIVGTSENSVNLVSAIEDKEAIDEIRLRAAQSGSRPERKSFFDLFAGSFRKGMNGGFGFSGSVNNSMGFIKQQRERLKKM